MKQNKSVFLKQQKSPRYYFAMIRLCSLFLLFSGITELCAQETILTSGGNSNGIDGSASYSIGQLVYTNNIGTNGTVAQGVQQPFEISVFTGIEENNIELMINVFPNPTPDYLNLFVQNINVKNLNYALFSLEGKLLFEEEIYGTCTKINLSGYSSSTLFLQVRNNQKTVKTFKIIKK
jgi:hypothetical protein